MLQVPSPPVDSHAGAASIESESEDESDQDESIPRLKAKAAREWVEHNPNLDSDKTEEDYIERVRNLISGGPSIYMLMVRGWVRDSSNSNSSSSSSSSSNSNSNSNSNSGPHQSCG